MGAPTWIDFILFDQNLPFTVALCLLLLVALLEGVSLLFGASFSNLVDWLLPDFDFNADLSTNTDSLGVFSKLLSWLRVGKVPIVILFLVFLASFSISGYVIQKSYSSLNGSLLPAGIAGLVAFVVCLPVVRYLAVILESIIPGDESNAVSRASFIGAEAIITNGIAKPDYPAEARLTDEYGQTHYIMVEPDSYIEIKSGAKVRVVKQLNTRFLVVLIDGEDG